MTNKEAFELIRKYQEQVQEEAKRLNVFEVKEGETTISINPTFTEWREKDKELLQELKNKVTIEQIILLELYNHESFYTEEPLEIMDTMKEYFEELSEEELQETILETYQKQIERKEGNQ